MHLWLAMQQPSETEFNEWKGHPVTEWVMGAVAKFARQQKDRWAQAAWENGELDPALLAEAKVRADCYLSLAESDYSDWKAINDPET